VQLLHLGKSCEIKGGSQEIAVDQLVLILLQHFDYTTLHDLKRLHFGYSHMDNIYMTTLPVAAGNKELLTSAITVTLNKTVCVCPDNITGTTSKPFDSDTDKVEDLNSTVVTV